MFRPNLAAIATLAPAGDAEAREYLDTAVSASRRARPAEAPLGRASRSALTHDAATPPPQMGRPRLVPRRRP